MSLTFHFIVKPHMPSKDLFSEHSNLYKAFRPEYPESLFEIILQHVPDTCLAWDVGTGNGQVAKMLSKYFKSVYATDISEKQLKEAPQIENICYARCSAENSGLPSKSVDLITVAQALHWFDFELFNTEVKRVARPGALIAIWGYELLHINEEIDNQIQDFYSGIIGTYWPPERKYIENAYCNINFPYKEIDSPQFSIKVNWTLEQFIGYLNTWSAVQLFIKQNQFNPVDTLRSKIQMFWNERELKKIVFPLFVRMGYITD